MSYERTRDGYIISDEQSRLDLDVIHGFLKDAYWCLGVPRDVVARSVRNSLSFGLYDRSGALVGFGRSVTDYATFAYFSDIFVLPRARGKGLGAWLVEAMMDHPDLNGLRHMLLATNDAQGLYEKFGFGAPRKPKNLMQWLDMDVYKRVS